MQHYKSNFYFCKTKTLELESSANKRKILNDPVHGLISIPSDFIYDLIEHPYFQRLRNIRQLGVADYVYPGATHSRFLHSIGTLHLMTQALSTLSEKGVIISSEEMEAAFIASLYHDLGHGPFSHAIEYGLTSDISHEEISLLIMQRINSEFNGRLEMAIKMFAGSYERKFFHDLISSQTDMDRLDYLVRDSFYTGVVEGSVGSARIIKMLNVSDDRLVIDEKGVYSIEKFLIARRFMYWQVYMHKTVLSAELLLNRIIERATKLISSGIDIHSTDTIDYFLKRSFSLDELTHEEANMFTDYFLGLDDHELICSIKKWSEQPDRILSDLSKKFLFRKLPAIELDNKPFNDKLIGDLREKIIAGNSYCSEGPEYYVYTGSISNMTYAPSSPRVRILDKSGALRELTEVSDMLDHQALSTSSKKYFLSYPKG